MLNFLIMSQLIFSIWIFFVNVSEFRCYDEFWWNEQINSVVDLKNKSVKLNQIKNDFTQIMFFLSFKISFSSFFIKIQQHHVESNNYQIWFSRFHYFFSRNQHFRSNQKFRNTLRNSAKNCWSNDSFLTIFE